MISTMLFLNKIVRADEWRCYVREECDSGRDVDGVSFITHFFMLIICTYIRIYHMIKLEKVKEKV